MARYEHLPIFRDSFDLAVHIEKIVRHFSRYHKYSLGTELRQQSRLIMEHIRQANNAQIKSREIHLLDLREQLEQLKVLVRLCHASGGFASTKAYLYVSEQIVGIAKQNEGWLRSYQNNNKQQNKVSKKARRSRRRRKQPTESGEAANGQNSLF